MPVPRSLFIQLQLSQDTAWFVCCIDQQSENLQRGKEEEKIHFCYLYNESVLKCQSRRGNYFYSSKLSSIKALIQRGLQIPPGAAKMKTESSRHFGPCQTIRACLQSHDCTQQFPSHCPCITCRYIKSQG